MLPPAELGNSEKIKEFTAGEVAILIRMERLEIEMKTMRREMGKFVTMEKFEPVQKIVYGMAGFVLFAFLSGIVVLIIP